MQHTYGYDASEVQAVRVEVVPIGGHRRGHYGRVTGTTDTAIYDAMRRALRRTYGRTCGVVRTDGYGISDIGRWVERASATDIMGRARIWVYTADGRRLDLNEVARALYRFGGDA